MEKQAIGSGMGRSDRPMLLESGTRRYPILSLSAESCLIEAPDHAKLRGFADIFDGERHVATCLIVLAVPEGANLRCFFKRRSEPQAGPARDFAR